MERSIGTANVRIHVEQVIGVVHQNYTILSATHPIALVSFKDSATALDRLFLFLAH